MIFRNGPATFVAGTVIADVFQLLGPDGEVVAELGYDTVSAEGPWVQLAMLHHNSQFGDSMLRWTDNTADPTDSAVVNIFGPDPRDSEGATSYPAYLEFRATRPVGFLQTSTSLNAARLAGSGLPPRLHLSTSDPSSAFATLSADSDNLIQMSNGNPMILATTNGIELDTNDLHFTAAGIIGTNGGATSNLDLRTDGQVFVANHLRIPPTGALIADRWLAYSDTDTGLRWASSGQFEFLTNNAVAGGVTTSGIWVSAADSNDIRIFSATDSNHRLVYHTGTVDGGSTNGPRLYGFTSVVLSSVTNSKNWLFLSSGNAFAPAGATWGNSSSIKVKRDIRPVDVGEALATVRKLRPVWYRLKEDESPEALRHVGVIAEQVHRHLPEVTTVRIPNEPVAVDYGRLSAHLIAAVQALALRLEALEESQDSVNP